ncbi:neurofilament heavy protein isoform X2 [Wolffia australiana]
MAARSPNLKLQKALIRHHHPSAKCPRSEPAKQTKSKICRVTEKATISSKLKNHPVAVLSSSTPKIVPKPKQIVEEASRSMKINRELQPKNRAVAKVLGFHTPKKSQLETPSIQELSTSIKKLNIVAPRSDRKKTEEAVPSSIDAKCRSEAEDESLEFDENKENAAVLDPVNRGLENRSEKRCDGPRKAIAGSGKTQSKPSQGVKFRVLKPTNPKPFRLRTDERGILREKNLEREKKPHAEHKPTAIAPRTKLRPFKDERTAAAPKKHVVSQPCKDAPAIKKALTVPRAPAFTKVNVPKCCVKRCPVAC